MDRVKIATIADTDKLVTDDLGEIEKKFEEGTSDYFEIAGDISDTFNKYEYNYWFFPSNVDNIRRGNIIHKRTYVIAYVLLVLVGTSFVSIVLPEFFSYEAPALVDSVYFIGYMSSLTIGITYLLDYVTRSVLGAYNIRDLLKLIEYGLTTIPCLLPYIRLYERGYFQGQFTVSILVTLFAWAAFILIMYVFLQQSQSVIVTSQSGERNSFVVNDEDSRKIVQKFQQKLS